MIPLWLKISYTLFVCLLVPVYWRRYGGANFLWFSDIALLATVPALWLESSMLASMMALAVVLPELAWNVDFFFRLLTGARLIGLSAYMFDRSIPRFLRALSLFHVGLPLLLLWMVHRLGYDERALVAQTIVAMIVLPLSYRFSEPRENINWVYGFGETPQTRVPAIWFLMFLILMFPLAIYLPTHIILDQLFSPANRASHRQPIQFSPNKFPMRLAVPLKAAGIKRLRNQTATRPGRLPDPTRRAACRPQRVFMFFSRRSQVHEDGGRFRNLEL